MRVRLLLAFLLVTAAAAAFAQPKKENTMPSVFTVPADARPSAHFDPVKATDAYLAQIPPAAKVRSDAYFEGGYWLILWDFLYGAVVALILLNFRWSAAMRDRAERITRRKPLQTALYWVQYLIVVSLLGFPLALYEGFIREHQYGMATQTFGPWLGDMGKALALNLVFGAVIMTILFGIVRKLPNTWWIWGAVVTVVFLVFFALLVPVFIVPVFNKTTRLNDPKITKPILSLARANGIPVNDVWEVDASRQTTRMSANVSGFGSTLRITLNDNLLKRGSPEEIEAVMAHEMGHYVLNHIDKFIVYAIIIVVVLFSALRFSIDWSLKRWGEKWRISGIGDVAVLPLVSLLASLFFFIATPLMNTMIRTQEQEADMYGLNAARQPDGFAQAAIHLGEYRKMNPGPIEEWIFFDHPSGHTRILNAMRWKGENLKLFADQATAALPNPTTPPPR